MHLSHIKITKYKLEIILWYKITLIIILFRNSIKNKIVVNKIILNHKHSMIFLDKENQPMIMFLWKVKIVEFLMLVLNQ